MPTLPIFFVLFRCDTEQSRARQVAICTAEIEFLVCALGCLISCAQFALGRAFRLPRMHEMLVMREFLIPFPAKLCEAIEKMRLLRFLDVWEINVCKTLLTRVCAREVN